MQCLQVSYEIPKQATQAGAPTPEAQAAVHAVHAPAQTPHCVSLQEVFSQGLLQPSLHLQQNTLHFPLPQHPKVPFRLQQLALALAANKESITRAKSITSQLAEVNLACMSFPFFEWAECRNQIKTNRYIRPL
jgi:hypothetical protein